MRDFQIQLNPVSDEAIRRPSSGPLPGFQVRTNRANPLFKWTVVKSCMLTDEELALRISATEDNFVERKTTGDRKDWIRAFVSLANSAPVNFPCVLFIGVKNDGRVEKNVGLESVQKTFADKARKVFPAIPYYLRVFTHGGDHCLAVVFEGSSDRPHYAGLPYVRAGTESIAPDADAFNRLVAHRDPKAREILKWRGKPVTVELRHIIEASLRQGKTAPGGVTTQVVKDCNQFWVTLELSDGQLQATSLRKIELSFDFIKNRLKLEIEEF